MKFFDPSQAKGRYKSLTFILIPLFIACLYLLPESFNRALLNQEIIFYQSLETTPSLSDKIVLVTIGDEDVRLLGGWPISRDYYSYAIYALNQSGARTIGLDIFFSGADKRYPRYDSTMADFLSSAGNVVLPMFFSELSEGESGRRGLQGIEPHFSIPLFNEAAAASGFSNLGADPLHIRFPLAAWHSGKLYFSFAAALFLDFTEGDLRDKRLPEGSLGRAIEESEYLYLHYPDLDAIGQKYSFVNLLQTFRNNPSLIDLNGKLVVVINTVTGVAQIKNTIFNEQLPASLIHISALDNLLKENWLRIIRPLPGAFIIFCLGVLVFFNRRIGNARLRRSLYWLIPGGFILAAVLIFISSQIIVPLVYALSAFAIGVIADRISIARAGQREDRLRRQEIDGLLHHKEEQLESTHKEIKDLSEKLSLEREVSEQSREQLALQKQSMADLEKEIADLQNYDRSEDQQQMVRPEGVLYAKTSPMTRVMDLVNKISQDDIPVLISGETGTGKEVIARTIHRMGYRNQAPFVAVNCGALPETLLESELFGHEKGSFTGATSLRKGRFELAEGGTVFLDEVTETTPAFQSRLLRILQESTFERVGGQKEIKADVRIIAATNKDVHKLMAQEKFRSDLFYRLNGFAVTIPPLRERKEDIPLLAEYFLTRHGYTGITGISAQAMERMRSYAWPGNVRELENCIRRAALLAQSEGRNLVREDDLPQDIREEQIPDQLQFIHKPLEDQVLELMRSFRFSRSAVVQTAGLLGNRDRGTITEHVKGICFEQIAASGFQLEEACKKIAGSADEVLLENVRQKVSDYLKNLMNYSHLPPQADKPSAEQAAPFRGLPKRYHVSLDLVLARLPYLLEQLNQ